MSLAIRPLISTLRRSPTGALLVALQVAITLAVLVNAAWVATQRIEKLERPTGIDTRNIFAIFVTGTSKRFHLASAESEDLAYLRGVAGVVAATTASGIPLSRNGGTVDYWREAGQRGPAITANQMEMDEQGLKTLGVSLSAGRNFRPDAIRPPGRHTPLTEIIVTQSLAHALFPHANALGKTVFNAAGTPVTIIGIAHNFMGPQIASRYRMALRPAFASFGQSYQLLVRTRPGRLNAVMRAAREHIGASHAYGIVDMTLPLIYAKLWFEAKNGTLIVFLALITALMLAVCCVGVFGLGTFNVSTRTKQIGIRRALGARKRDVVAHFMTENALILATGALLGSALALAVGNWLTAHYGVARLDPTYLAVGVVLLCLIGQLAAWQPARRAAAVSPSVATRTV